MSRSEAWSFHASNALVALTGMVYAWMRYFARSDDPFAAVNHPWQPTLQHLHVLGAPLLVFVAGWVGRQHVLGRITSGSKPRRASGLVLALLFVPMAASGYLLQTATDEAWRTAWVVVHVATSVLWIGACVGHVVRGGRALFRAQASESGSLASGSTRG